MFWTTFLKNSLMWYLQFNPLPCIQIEVVKVIHSGILKKDNHAVTPLSTSEAATATVPVLTRYLPPNTKPLLPTVAQAWAARGEGAVPCQGQVSSSASACTSGKCQTLFTRLCMEILTRWWCCVTCFDVLIHTISYALWPQWSLTNGTWVANHFPQKTVQDTGAFKLNCSLLVNSSTKSWLPQPEILILYFWGVLLTEWASK